MVRWFFWKFQKFCDTEDFNFTYTLDINWSKSNKWCNRKINWHFSYKYMPNCYELHKIKKSDNQWNCIYVRYHIETSPLICSANQWTGFYMMAASVMKESTMFTFHISIFHFSVAFQLLDSIWNATLRNPFYVLLFYYNYLTSKGKKRVWKWPIGKSCYVMH